MLKIAKKQLKKDNKQKLSTQLLKNNDNQNLKINSCFLMIECPLSLFVMKTICNYICLIDNCMIFVRGFALMSLNNPI